MALVFRREQRTYMNLGTFDSPIWSLIGEGFTDFSTDFGANEDERHYIHEKNARTITIGFAKTISFAMDMYSDNAVCKRVARAFDEEQIGSASEVDVLTVKYFEEGYADNTYFAKRQSYSIAPGNEGDGNGGNVYEHSGTFNALGDPVIGSWAGTLEQGGAGEFTPRPTPTVPGAPTAVSVTPGDGLADVTFTPPASTGGAKITGYTATAAPAVGSPVAASGLGSPITINGLTNGVEYTVTVVATNEAGNGTASTGVTVTPTA